MSADAVVFAGENVTVLDKKGQKVPRYCSKNPEKLNPNHSRILAWLRDKASSSMRVPFESCCKVALRVLREVLAGH